MAESFTGLALLEKDLHDEVIWTWVYPSISLALRDTIKRRVDVVWDSDLTPFFYGQFQKQWHYICSEDVSLDRLPKVTRLAIILLASDFNPDKYSALGRALLKLYKKSCNPAVLLENYLLVFTKGVCSTDENGTFQVQDHDSHSLLANSRIKDVVGIFGLETILVYIALLLKKRVVVYHPNVEMLQNLCRALPTLVCHRQNWNILYPLVTIADSELADLKTSTFYIAGFADSRVENRTDLFDIFVNGHSKEITVASHAKGTFMMGKLHKELATFITESAEKPNNSDILCIKDIARKTKELINNLKSFSSNDEHGNLVITMNSFHEKKMPTVTREFLINLAAAEGMLKL